MVFSYLKGKIKHMDGSQVTLCPNENEGYLVNLVALANIDDKLDLEVFIHTAVRENEISLWGFKSQSDLKFFQMLLSVSGVGLRTAQGLMEAVGVDQIVSAIAADEPNLIKAPGVGKKTAERIIIDLRNKIDDFISMNTGEGETTKPKVNYMVEDAVAAVVSLGYNEQEVRKTVREIDITSIDEPQTLIKQILKFI